MKPRKHYPVVEALRTRDVHVPGAERDPDSFIPTRRPLLGRLKRWDDQEAWREFFETYWRLIYGVGLKAGLSQEEAQDVVQETLLSVAKTMSEFRYDPAACSFKTWLQHLTRKRIIDQLRKRPPRQARCECSTAAAWPTPTLEQVPDPASLDLGKVWEEEWQQNLLEMAIEKVKAKVDPKPYQMFFLYGLKQLPIEEVMRRLRATRRQVYLAKYRVSVLLKKEIKKLEKTMP